MSSKVFRIWPALALVLLLAVVWHWGVPAEPVSAQDSRPDHSVAVAPEWQWMGGSVTVTGSGFSPGVLAWAFVYSGDGPKDCRSIGVQDNYADDVVVGDDGSVSFALPVETTVGFAGGEGNYLCLIDRLGVGADLEPVRLSVVVPDPVYRMQLDISSIAEDPNSAFAGIADLPADFSVVDGRHHDNWNLPQERRVGTDVLLRTSGQWSRCQDQPVGGTQLGCIWDQEPTGGGEAGKIYMTAVPSNAKSVTVPGDSLEFRLSLNSDDLGANRAAERFVIYWGPVDLWKLGGSLDDDGNAVAAWNYVIEGQHLNGLQRKIVLQSDLDEDGSVTVTIPRSSANFRGDTFVAMVPCNDDYLQDNFTGPELDGALRALRDCSEISTIPRSDRDDTGEGRPGVLRAWSQHSILSGLGMSCDVRIFDDRAPDANAPKWARTIRCKNDLTKPVLREEYDACMEVLGREVDPRHYTGQEINPARNFKCGMGKYRDYNSGRLVAKPTASSLDVFPAVRYNAARAFYGFTVKWAKGYGSWFAPGCSISLLPYVPSGEVGHYAASEFLDRWLTKEYELDDDITDDDPRCVAPPGARELSVNFYVPPPPEEPVSSWAKTREEFYLSHPVHFALYVQGMPSAHDYRSDDAEESGSWRRVWLGSWADAGDRDGPLRPLGFAYPTRDAESLTLPAVSAMTDGYSIEVSRDYANLNGELELYVVPCRPTYSDQQSPAIQSEGSCEDLPERAAAPLGVAFDFVDNEEGPFGVDDSGESGGYLVNYSAKVRVKFVSVSWNESMARAVSPPAEWDPTEPTGTDCSLASVLPVRGTPDEAYWPETTVQGGPCDRRDLSPVRVGFSGVVADNLVVYTTGGRTADLDLVQMHRATATSAVEPLGRLGIRERRLSLDAGGTGHILVSPDLAGHDGNVWLVAYSCNGETHGSVRCPLITRGRDAPVYDIAHPPAFVVRVRFLPESGLKHTDIGPVCQGADCNPLMPVLREALPDGGMGSCEVSSYAGGAADLVYWPDRLVQGGACAPDGISPVSVSIRNPSEVASQKLVLYATGGRTAGLERVQVRRGGRTDGTDDVGEPSGEVGLRKTEMTLDAGGSGSILVDPDLADRDGQVWLLAYRCSEPGAVCPAATAGGDLITYAVDRRPLFQVLVQFDRDLISISNIRICRGDAPCSESYPLGRVSRPDGDHCGVVATRSGGRLYWPDRVVARGACDRDSLEDVPVTFSVPASTSEERLVVYVTGGRSRGLEEVDVYVDDGSGSGANQFRDGQIPVLKDLPLDGAGIRASVTAVIGILEGKDWMADGLTDPVERKVYNGMKQLAARGGDLAEEVARMSFLDAVDETDYLTVEALEWAASRNVADDIVDHQEFDDGIMDTDRILVIGAALYSDDGTAAVVGRLDARTLYG